ncbi:MAG: T9SS type A sorting domain-containing protein [Chitinispirillaceae bacterium]|nr:T9SS type A sorting domain-containing protein [Chitinispirillaceae bacterium]
MTRKIKFPARLLMVVGFIIAAGGSTPYETFRQSYNLLSTIAGNGAADNNNANLWLAEYEGLRAVTIDYQGNVLVTENDRGFVRRIEKVGAGVVNRRIVPWGASLQAHSDPVSGSIRCMFTLAAPLDVTIRLFDQSGRMKEVLMSRRTGAGRHEIRRQGGSLPAGLYFINLQAETVSLTRRLVVFH